MKIEQVKVNSVKHHADASLFRIVLDGAWVLRARLYKLVFEISVCKERVLEP
jgi:hypothetical protein